MVVSDSRSQAVAQEQGRVKNGITFDTGALIALERRGQRIRKVLERATEQKIRITVPAAVVTEWWRSRTDIRERILAAVSGATAVDAIVMASAAQRGDVVYTADVADLTKLAGYFRAVRVLGIG